MSVRKGRGTDWTVHESSPYHVSCAAINSSHWQQGVGEQDRCLLPGQLMAHPLGYVVERIEMLPRVWKEKEKRID